MTVTRIAPMSLAKISAVLYAILGLIFGGIISIFSTIGGAFADESEAGMAGMMFGAAAVIILPIFYACLGFVGSLLMASLYNAVAGWVGGVEMDLR